MIIRCNGFQLDSIHIHKTRGDSIDVRNTEVSGYYNYQSLRKESNNEQLYTYNVSSIS